MPVRAVRAALRAGVNKDTKWSEDEKRWLLKQTKLAAGGLPSAVKNGMLCRQAKAFRVRLCIRLAKNTERKS